MMPDAEGEWTVGGMPRTGVLALVRVSASLAAGEEGRLGEALDDARSLPPEAVEEVLLQSYLFLGYPAALNGFALWRRISGRVAGAAAPHRPGEWPGRGEEVCRAVYGGTYPALRDNIRALHPDMERWMVEEGYGKVLGRPGLPLPVRELCIAGILSVIRAPRQLHSHLRGALNTGAGEEAVEAALQVARAYQSPERQVVADEVWSAVRDRWRSGRGNRSGAEP